MVKCPTTLDFYSGHDFRVMISSSLLGPALSVELPGILSLSPSPCPSPTYVSLSLSFPCKTNKNKQKTCFAYRKYLFTYLINKPLDNTCHVPSIALCWASSNEQSRPALCSQETFSTVEGHRQIFNHNPLPKVGPTLCRT